MNLKPRTYELTECDREPIHQIGFVQPFGGLIAATTDWQVAHFSTNAGAMLGLGENPALGAPLNSLLSERALARLRDMVARLSLPDQVERQFDLALVEGGPRLDVAVHVMGSTIIIEFEPHGGESFAEQISRLGPAMAQIDRQTSIEGLCRAGATQMKAILGYDRVMVYRFHGDGSGEVIAEEREDDLEPFMGLRYPRTDVPEQARELFVRNRFRITADVHSDPVPIEPVERFGAEPLDLSMSMLRAQSPVHLEYLINMGVTATLSIAVVIKGKLWGLFACHHYSPRLLPYAKRTAAELFSQLFSLTIERALLDRDERLREDGRKLHDKLMLRLAAGDTLADSLPLLDDILEETLPHDGSSVLIDGVYRARGSAPSEEEFRALLPAFNSAPTSRIIATSSLANDLEAAAAIGEKAAGAMIIPISRDPRDYLVLWRRELAQLVTWAGDPVKSVSQPGERLSPRKSFAAWKETVRGEAQSWNETELALAESLRVTLIEVILRLTDNAVRERTKAQAQQDLLIAELNHRVRNILNLIRSLIDQSKHDVRDIGSFVELISGRIGALASAHDHITRENWSPAPVSELIEAEMEAYLQQKRERVRIEGTDVLVSPEAYTVLALVIHEMVTNSAKYGSLCDRRGELTVSLSRNADDDLEIAWRESGGPEVKPPTRRGFGSTIIERSIPFELKGTSQVRYEPAGLEADFLVPARFISAIPAVREVAEKGTPAMAANNNAPEQREPPARALIIEDSMIIAMDAEDCLRELGVSRVDTASSVLGALEAIREARPDFAIVDANLGDETSEKVVEELVSQSVPFVLATGYGDMSSYAGSDKALRIIRKPYGKAELAAALGLPETD